MAKAKQIPSTILLYLWDRTATVPEAKWDHVSQCCALSLNDGHEGVTSLRRHMTYDWGGTLNLKVPVTASGLTHLTKTQKGSIIPRSMLQSQDMIIFSTKYIWDSGSQRTEFCVLRRHTFLNIFSFSSFFPWYSLGVWFIHTGRILEVQEVSQT